MRDSSEATLENGGLSPLAEIEDFDDTDYLGITQRAYRSGVDYQTANLKAQWDKNICNFLSLHPPGSKYKTPEYRHRSRLFRPKTRASIRSKEAALVLAFFSTSDAVVISSEDQDNEESVKAARLLKRIVDRRMEGSLMWFQNSIAAFQETMVMGVVISHQGWERIEEEYEESVDSQEYDEMTGGISIVQKKIKKTRIIKDEPFIQLIPNENFFIDPGAHWIDPIGTTPFTVEMIPMHVVDVLDRMDRVDTLTGQPTWKEYSMAEISRAASSFYDSDSTRLAKEGGRQDPKSDVFTDIEEYEIVWVFRVIAKIPGKGDLIWYTLGESLMLTDPVPVQEVYKHLKPGEKPYVAGVSIIEAHRNYPSAVAQLGQDIQAATNHNMNQRFDNIQQVLNKRTFVKRDRDVDLRSLRRNIPGSITLMTDPQTDVKIHETGDITASSYNEQNLFNSDFDEITGSFSPGSVQNNRQAAAGETMGGMRMLKDPSNTLTEYLIRVFAETWAKPVLQQIVRLEQAYETDEALLASIKEDNEESKTASKPVNIKDPNLRVSVSVGYGVTDPEGRIRRVLFGVESLAKIAPKSISKIKEEEITKEVMGILGYQDGTRFYRTKDEHTQWAKDNPQAPNETALKIASQEKIEEAKIMSAERMKIAEIQDNDNIWEARIMSNERAKVAELTVTSGKEIDKYNLELGKRDIDIDRLRTDKLGLAIKREDMLRKDAEIKDKENIERNRSGGPSVESKA